MISLSRKKKHIQILFWDNGIDSSQKTLTAPWLFRASVKLKFRHILSFLSYYFEKNLSNFSFKPKGCPKIAHKLFKSTNPQCSMLNILKQTKQRDQNCGDLSACLLLSRFVFCSLSRFHVFIASRSSLPVCITAHITHTRNRIYANKVNLQ